MCAGRPPCSLVNVSQSADAGKNAATCLGAASPWARCEDGKCLGRYNELVLRWTTTETWTFAHQFNVSASTLAQQNVDLLMTGVDTIAAIYVDNTLVANTSSVHRWAGPPHVEACRLIS